MTGLLHEKDLSRKTFLKGGGALIVGFSMAGFVSKGARAAGSPYASNPVDQNQLDSWIAINSDNTATIKAGLNFQGTGSETAVHQIAAEELYMDVGQMIFFQANTGNSPNTGSHSASNTVTLAGGAIRTAAAVAHQTLLGLASTHLGVPVSVLSVKSGVVSGGGQSVTYGQLIGGKLFNLTLPASYSMQNAAASVKVQATLAPGVSPAKPVSQYTVVGTNVPRIDIPAIVTGSFTYVQNVVIPGMLHGRVVRPRGGPVYGFGAPILSVDESSIAHIPGARVLRQNDFLGVVAPHEYDAIQAASILKVKWADPPAVLPGNGSEAQGMRALDTAGKTLQSFNSYQSENFNHGNVDQALASAAHVVSRTYHWPSNLHATLGPQCCLADVTPQGARIFAGTQSAFSPQAAIASATGLPVNVVQVTCPAIGGAFGSNAAVDCAVSAALLSQLAGAPVRLQFMRWDDLGWDNSAPGVLMDIRAGMDTSGNMVTYEFNQFYPQYGSGPVTAAALAGAAFPATASSSTGNTFPQRMYQVIDTTNPATSNRYLLKAIPLLGNWIASNWMRAGATPAGIFAGEQIVDELAHIAGMDPVAFRIQNVTQDPVERPDLLAVLNAVTQAANWKPKVAASDLSDANVVTGRGIAWSNAYNSSTDIPEGRSTVAALADIEVNKKTGKITVKHVYGAAAVGLAVNPGLVENQIVGGMVQVTSRLLVESLAYNKQHITSSDFITYPLLRFKDAPKVTPIVVQQPNQNTKGLGEHVSVPVAGAIANAFFDATGVRMQTAPMTSARVRATLKAAGIV